MRLGNVPLETSTVLWKMTVCHLKSVSQFSITIQVSDREVKVVVDSAAEVTSSRTKLRDIKLIIVGRTVGMKVFAVGPTSLKIGLQWYNDNRKKARCFDGYYFK